MDARTTPVPAGFSPPDFQAPLDLVSELAALPQGVQARGMFFTDALRACERAGRPVAGAPSYVAWKMYPVEDLMRLWVDAAGRVYPKASPRQGLFQLGLTAYDVILESLAGRVVFGVLGRNIQAAFRASTKAYEISLSRGSGRVLDVGEHHALLHLVDIHNFLDSWQLGALAGAIRSLGREGDVHIRPITRTEAQVYCRWW